MGGVNAKVMDTKGGHSREITVFNKLVRHKSHGGKHSRREKVDTSAASCTPWDSRKLNGEIIKSKRYIYKKKTKGARCHRFEQQKRV